MNTKRCTRCKRKYAAILEFFPKNSRSMQLDSWCRNCYREKAKARYWEKRSELLDYGRQYRNAKRETIRAKDRERYWSDPEASRERVREYRRNNLDKVREAAKEYRQNNPEKRRETARRSCKKHADRIRVYKKARRLAGLDRPNREKVRASKKRRYWATPEKSRREAVERYWKDPKKFRERSSSWSKRHTEELKEKRYARYWANPEMHRAAARAWAIANPEKVRVRKQNRRAREKSAPGCYTPKDLLRIYLDQNGLCYYCETDLLGDYHADHKVPLARGGTNNSENICCACPHCNWSKNNKTVEEFVRFRLKRGLAVSSALIPRRGIKGKKAA